MKYKDYEIPAPQDMTGWKEIPIIECNEPLVLLNTETDYWQVKSGYAEQGIPTASTQLFAREGVASRLVTASRILRGFNPDAQLLLLDAFRPRSVQEALYNGHRESIKATKPEWSDDMIDTRTQRYVSIPSTDPLKPAPHITGGAIDLTIISKGEQLSMGTKWDYFGKKAGTDYFEKATTAPAITYKENRRLLAFCMDQAGFTNYHEEWWHYDFGNQFHAKTSGNPQAIYSIATPPTAS